MSEKHAIGIDLGGTNLRVALVSSEGKISRKIRKPSSEQIIDALVDSIAEIRQEISEYQAKLEEETGPKASPRRAPPKRKPMPMPGGKSTRS